MADFSVAIAYALTFGLPALIMGFGAFANEIKGASIVAFLTIISLLAYFTHTGAIAYWVLILVLIILSLFFVLAFKSILGDS